MFVLVSNINFAETAQEIMLNSKLIKLAMYVRTYWVLIYAYSYIIYY